MAHKWKKKRHKNSVWEEKESIEKRGMFASFAKQRINMPEAVLLLESAWKKALLLPSNGTSYDMNIYEYIYTHIYTNEKGRGVSNENVSIMKYFLENFCV